MASAKSARNTVPLVVGLERENGLLARCETIVRPDADRETLLYVERLVKFMVWAYGGWKIYLGGPAPIGEYLSGPSGLKRV